MALEICLHALLRLAQVSLGRGELAGKFRGIAGA